MSSFNIYYGPELGFKKFLNGLGVHENNSISFSALVRKSDEIQSTTKLLVQGSDASFQEPEKIEYEHLVIKSDEYAGVKEHVLLNFEGFISSSRFELKNIHFHNPPELIKNKAKYLDDNINIEYFEYSGFSKEILINFNNEYENSIIGQSQVKDSLLTSFVPLMRNNYKKPVVLLFFGPSGVGKTESAKFLSNLLGGNLFRKQLSMFQNNEFISYLFGGHIYENSFAKELLERETNVILLDEFDKANNVFFSAFYQFFDEGIYSDKNYEVEIGKSVIICTSNYNTLEEVRAHLGDPIFARFDNCIQFKELETCDIRKIVTIQIDKQYSELDEHEKAIIQKEKINNLFESHLHSFKNARRVESLVREVISNLLLKEYYLKKE